jgi:O-antigen/teichoic acid export membrane protein
MLNHLKETLKHTAIYSIGNITTKLIGIVLLPLYTKHITVSEYGVLGIVEISIMILTQVLMLGQPQALLRYYYSAKYSDRKQAVFSILSLILIAILLFTLSGIAIIPSLAKFFEQPSSFRLYFSLSIWIIILRVINKFSLTLLRAKEKSVYYAISNIIKLIIVLGLNIYFIAFLRLGIVGILYAYIIGDGVLFVILAPLLISEIKISIDKKFLLTTILFGFPLIFSALSSMILNLGDRYILKLLTNYKEVGLYSLGYKIAGFINVFIIHSFTQGFLPRVYKVYGTKGDKRYYAKMLTYFCFFLFWFGLALSIFGKEIITLFARNKDYYIAYTVIPYIALGYVFAGAKAVAFTGLYLKHKTKYIAYITIGAAVLNIILNFLLIPKFGMYGAAVTTMVSYFIFFIITMNISNKYYSIPYEKLKILMMLIVSLGIFFIAMLTQNMFQAPRIIVKSILLFSFPFWLLIFKFYEPVEIEQIKKYITKIFGCSKNKD